MVAVKPYYFMRFVGGALFFAGAVLMAWNLWATARGARTVAVAISCGGDGGDNSNGDGGNDGGGVGAIVSILLRGAQAHRKTRRAFDLRDFNRLLDRRLGAGFTGFVSKIARRPDGQALYRVATGRTRHLHPRIVRAVPHAADPPVRGGSQTLRRLFAAPASSFTTARFCGAPSAQAQISRAWAASSATNGIACICKIRARWFRIRSCLLILGSPNRR